MRHIQYFGLTKEELDKAQYWCDTQLSNEGSEEEKATKLVLSTLIHVARNQY